MSNLLSRAEFESYERYEGEDGTVAVERNRWLYRECAADTSPSAITTGAYANYIFQIEPIPQEFGMERLEE